MDDNRVTEYCNLMEEVKLRINVINDIGSGRTKFATVAIAVETAYLQLRKILELIAFGSLMTHKELFSDIYGKISKVWQADDILKQLRSVHPNFYPEPIVDEPTESGINDLRPKTDGFLTEREFAELYGRCGNLLHASNPFGKGTNYQDYLDQIPTWSKKIVELLNSHKIRLADDDSKFYLIHMDEGPGSNVKHYTFEKLSENPEEAA